MNSYDWIVIGAGITGAAIAYELSQKGFSVLLLEQNAIPNNATRYSYGGLAFWSGTTPLTRQLCDRGLARHRVLSAELEADTEFRELDLLLTIPRDIDPQGTAAAYSRFATPPQLLRVDEACELEPLLNREAISGALTVKHGHIHPDKTRQAYIQAFVRLGGEIQIARVLELEATWKSQQPNPRVKTTKETYQGGNVIVCAGGFSRELLRKSAIPIQLYFTHAEIIETPAVDVKLRTLVMPAVLQRFRLEAESTHTDELWNQQGNDLGSILDAGAVQFQDGSLRLGQISRAFTDTNATFNATASETLLRQNLGEILPALANLPGTWRNCLVAFSKDSLPLIGEIPGWQGIYIFSGFSNPLVFIPPLAQGFANFAIGNKDEILSQLSPSRFQ
ncbi:MAG: FAD-binding oxidoreductase [Nostocaceae cyanobacterium]|nr:FAD-binding oxidoreductase [Nostocaceae cyanobacterium]